MTFLPVSEELMDDYRTMPSITVWIARELSESMLWKIAGIPRPATRTFDAFAHYKPRLFLPRRKRQA